MKWPQNQPVKPEEQKTNKFPECLYGAHSAQLLHRGTAYCRACYDDKARQGKLIDQ